MTSLRQIESNRRNALKSTGSKTETGKLRSTKNAVRHALTAERPSSSLVERLQKDSLELVRRLKMASTSMLFSPPRHYRRKCARFRREPKSQTIN